MGSEWKQVVPDLVSIFTQSPELISSLFTILEVLPDECENAPTTSRVSKEAVESFRTQIKVSAPEILRSLGSPAILGKATDVASQSKVLRCFAHWLRACDVPHIPTALHDHPLIATSFDALSSSDLFESALFAVCELVLISTYKGLRQLVEYSVSRARSYLPSYKQYVYTLILYVNNLHR